MTHNYLPTTARHYDLFRQSARLKEAISKRTFFCFSAALIQQVLKGAKCLEFNLFMKMKSIICIVAIDTILP